MPLSTAGRRRPRTTVLLGLGLVIVALTAFSAFGLALSSYILRALFLVTCTPPAVPCNEGAVVFGESLTDSFRIALMVGTALSLPLILDQSIRFVAPQRRQIEGQFVVAMLVLAPALYLVGALAGALVIAPALREMLPSSIPAAPFPILQVAIRASFWFGIAAVVPLLLTLAARLHLVRWRRFAVLLPVAAIVAWGVALQIVPWRATEAVTAVTTLLTATYGLGILGARLATSTPIQGGGQFGSKDTASDGDATTIVTMR